MKKRSFAMVMTLFTTIVIAQEKPVIGIKAGLNATNINVQNLNNAYDTKLGFHVGAVAHIHLTRKVAFQPELQFSTQGAEYKNTDNKVALSYINIPFMFQYMFNNGFRIEAGPQVGLIVNAEDKIGDLDIDRDKEFKETDVSIGVGLNYLSYSGFGVGGRYNFGVSNIYKGSANNLTNRVFQLSIFYMFESGHKAKSK